MRKKITIAVLAMSGMFTYSASLFANSCTYQANVKSYVGATVEITDFYYKYVDDPFAFWDPIALKRSEMLDNSTNVYTASVTNITLTCDSQDYALALKYNCTRADGATHIIFEPLDFIARLVPRPRVNLTRYHGVFAHNSKYRVWITPTRRGKQAVELAPASGRAFMTWANEG